MIGIARLCDDVPVDHVDLGTLGSAVRAGSDERDVVLSTKQLSVRCAYSLGATPLVASVAGTGYTEREQQ